MGFYIKGKEVLAGNIYFEYQGSWRPSGKADTTDKI